MAQRRAAWLKQLHRWHWISSAISLAALLFFALTGLTLNHVDAFPARTQVQRHTWQLPPTLLQQLHAMGHPRNGTPLPPAVAQWLATQSGERVAGQGAEWSAEEIYLPLPAPGVDVWLRIQRADGQVEHERAERGWIAVANDLHKGRHTSGLWRGLIDLIALGCLVFALTGLWILKLHAAKRRSVWPLVAVGALLPLLVFACHG